MKRYINKIVLMVLVLFAAGCSDDFLETSPTNAVSPNNALSTPANMMVALNGIHRTMYQQSDLSIGSASYNQAGEGYILPLLEFPASDALHTTTGNGWFLYNLQWIRHTNSSASDVAWLWYHFYHIIGSVNAIINASEGMSEDELLSNVLGQAKAYRAWAYHRLIQFYAKSYIHGTPASDLGVPLMLATEAPYEGLPRATVKEVYDQIVKDIEESIVHFKNASSRPNKSHLSLSVAQGIAARVFLTKGDWAKAATYANDARKGYSLMGETEYKNGFNSVEGTEWMWGGRIVPDQTTYFYAWFYYIGTNFNGTQNRTNPKIINKKLYNQIASTDYRKGLFLEKAPNDIVGYAKDPNYATKAEFDAAKKVIREKYGMTTSFKQHPYMAVKFLNKSAGTIEPDDVLYMRVSEMYLIEAEALARSGQSGPAAQVLYSLVSARDKAYTLSTKTGNDLIEEIKLHRRIELWGEGHRWFDMIRYDEELDRTDTGADPSIYQKGFKQAKPSVNVNWIFQIPQSEMDANPNITPDQQNPTAPL